MTADDERADGIAVKAMPLIWDALPAERIFPLPFADTRSPLSTVTPRWDRPDGTHGIDATMAADFPAVGLTIPLPSGDLDLRLGIAAAGFLGFSNDGSLTFGLQTFDGLFAFPLDVRWNHLSARLQWAHLSAHFGDGARYLGLRPWSTPGWSREYLQFQVGYQLGPARPYLGLRSTTHGTGEETPLGLQIGADLTGPWAVSPCGAADLQTAADTGWRPAVALQIGACATGKAHRFRAAFLWHTGPDETGKLQGAEERYIGVQFGFDQTTSILRWSPG